VVDDKRRLRRRKKQTAQRRRAHDGFRVADDLTRGRRHRSTAMLGTRGRHLGGLDVVVRLKSAAALGTESRQR
jgi:hypothetical protein